MPTCVNVNSTTDFTTTALANPADGFSFALIYATPVPTASATPLPTPSETPLPTPTETPAPTATAVPPTPTPTAAAGFSTDPCAPSTPTGYGSAFKMNITLNAANIGDPSSFVWFQLDMGGRLLHIDNVVDEGTDAAGVRTGTYIGDDPGGCPTPSNPIGGYALKYSDLTGAGRAIPQQLVGLGYTTSSIAPGPYVVWFE